MQIEQKSLTLNTIGIEICHPDWTGKFTDVTLNAVKELVVTAMLINLENKLKGK